MPPCNNRVITCPVTLVPPSPVGPVGEALVIDSDADLSGKIDHMKASEELLPISGRRPRVLHSHRQQLGGTAESILIN